jgi:hypothetical protein
MHPWRRISSGLSCLAAMMIVASGAVFGCAVTGDAQSCCCGHQAKAAQGRSCCAGGEAESTPLPSQPVRCGACCERDEAVPPPVGQVVGFHDRWQSLNADGPAAILASASLEFSSVGQYLTGASPPGWAHPIAPSLNVLFCTFQE